MVAFSYAFTVRKTFHILRSGNCPLTFSSRHFKVLFIHLFNSCVVDLRIVSLHVTIFLQALNHFYVSLYVPMNSLSSVICKYKCFSCPCSRRHFWVLIPLLKPVPHCFTSYSPTMRLNLVKWIVLHPSLPQNIFLADHLFIPPLNVSFLNSFSVLFWLELWAAY